MVAWGMLDTALILKMPCPGANCRLARDKSRPLRQRLPPVATQQGELSRRLCLLDTLTSKLDENRYQKDNYVMVTYRPPPVMNGVSRRWLTRLLQDHGRSQAYYTATVLCINLFPPTNSTSSACRYTELRKKALLDLEADERRGRAREANERRRCGQ